MKLLRMLRGRSSSELDASFAYAVGDLNKIAEANRILCSRFGGRLLDDAFLEYRRADTLFILGSGPSINELSQAAFTEIGAADSIGFNYWFAHDFVPSMFMFQLPPKASDPMMQLARRRRADYDKVPFIFRGSRLLENVSMVGEAVGPVFGPQAVWLLNELAPVFLDTILSEEKSR